VRLARFGPVEGTQGRGWKPLLQIIFMFRGGETAMADWKVLPRRGYFQSRSEIGEAHQDSPSHRQSRISGMSSPWRTM
jgi:hypothetical protein